jgi:N-acetylneuraminate synthase/N,N'-diacetyllegionaminate synthase
MVFTSGKTVHIGSRKVGTGEPAFIIAEAGVNHNGDLDLAERLVDAAAGAGADAVKFQTFHAERLVSLAAPKAEYQRERTDATESQLDMLRRLELSPEAHRELHSYCRQRGIIFLSTPFDTASADLLEELEVPAFKIGSGEITNWPLLEYVARKGKPVILSTGMSYLSEVDEAVRTMQESGCEELILLHCVSNYPAKASDANLRAIHTMAAAFGVPVGYSDHTLGIEVPVAAVALGACVIEKHLTLDRSLSGPDHHASFSPAEFAEMTRAIREVETALGDGRKQPMPAEVEVCRAARRSLVAACEIPAGTRIGEGMVAAMRPGTGLPPFLLPKVIGRVVRRRIGVGELLDWEMLC